MDLDIFRRHEGDFDLIVTTSLAICLSWRWPIFTQGHRIQRSGEAAVEFTLLRVSLLDDGILYVGRRLQPDRRLLVGLLNLDSLILNQREKEFSMLTTDSILHGSRRCLEFFLFSLVHGLSDLDTTVCVLHRGTHFPLLHQRTVFISR